MTGQHSPRQIVVMGVSGAGKSTVGLALAARTGAVFVDADDLHPRANVEKMASGIPLDDSDRQPWLETVGRTIAREADASTSGVVAACSALTRRYRDVLRKHAPTVVFVHLAPGRDELKDRLTSRAGHFMPATLLVSQLNTIEPLEADEPGITVTQSLPSGDLVRQILTDLATVSGSRASVKIDPGQITLP